ncbi:TPA_asm: hypothetical protein G1Q02_18930 [Salmonella enterica subsp. enterica serovar Typhimurium]|nr:hypothetical protein [Salmonella enterica subsp. enterica serovar Typhimurium]
MTQCCDGGLTDEAVNIWKKMLKNCTE